MSSGSTGDSDASKTGSPGDTAENADASAQVAQSNAATTETKIHPDYPESSEVRKLLVWGVIIIGALLAAAAIFAGVIVFLGGLEFKPVDPRQLGFLVAGTAVASILSLIALYSIIVKGHLAPFVSVMVLIAFGLSAYLIMSPDIGDMRHARGVITVIFTVGTVSIAMILVMGVMFSKWQKEDDLKNRFEGAKQVLTMLLGILGTVVGFYFGSADDAIPSEPLSVSRLAIDPKEPVAGEELVLSFSIDGGKRPFIYSLTILGLDPPIEFKGVETTERHIQHSVPLTNNGVVGAKLGFEVTVKDGDQHTAKLHKPVGAWVTAKASPPQPSNDPSPKAPAATTTP